MIFFNPTQGRSLSFSARKPEIIGCRELLRLLIRDSASLSLARAKLAGRVSPQPASIGSRGGRSSTRNEEKSGSNSLNPAFLLYLPNYLFSKAADETISSLSGSITRMILLRWAVFLKSSKLCGVRSISAHPCRMRKSSLVSWRPNSLATSCRSQLKSESWVSSSCWGRAFLQPVGGTRTIEQLLSIIRLCN